MRTSVKCIFAACLLGSPTLAQNLSSQIRPAPKAVFAGTYYVATGTFVPVDRATLSSVGTLAGLGGGDEIFNQSAQSGYYFNQIGSGGLIDEGIIPNGTMVAGGQDGYQVTNVMIGYVNELDATIDMTIDLFDAYTACSDYAAAGAPAYSIVATGLPGGAGALSAFLVNLDLTGVDVCLAGTDGTSGMDFGYSYRFDVASSPSGPLLCGMPDICPPGDGTFYQNPGVGCDGAGSGSGLGAQDSFYLEGAGGCVWFGGYPGAPFSSFLLTVSSDLSGACGDNDNCANPESIAGQGAFAFDSTGATTGTEGQAECGTIGLDLWYAWTADADGIASVTTCAGVSFDSKLAAYPGGGCPADGTSLDCNDDSCSLQSTVTFNAVNGTEYLIQVGGYSTSSGSGTFSISIDSPPANDDCSSPDIIAGQGTTSFDTSLASTGAEGQAESNCDFFGTTAVGSDIWYTWTADMDGTATITTCGTGYDTKLAAYPGAGCPVDGSSIACNDDDCALQSTIMFAVTNGGVYTIQVGSYPFASGGAGDFTITIAEDTIGTNYCSSVANSTGNASEISAIGSTSMVDEDVTLRSSNAPAGQTAVFFVGANQIELPFGNGGSRCVAGSIWRFSVVGEADGVFTYPIDFSTYGAILAGYGGTVNCQCWYRDPSVGPDMYNTSNGLELVLAP